MKGGRGEGQMEVGREGRMEEGGRKEGGREYTQMCKCEGLVEQHSCAKAMSSGLLRGLLSCHSTQSATVIHTLTSLLKNACAHTTPLSFNPAHLSL